VLLCGHRQFRESRMDDLDPQQKTETT